MDDPTIIHAQHSSEPTSLAPQACQSCRKQKRKCDKALPACGLCVKIGRACDYVTENAAASGAAPASEEFAALRQQVADLQRLVEASMTTNGPMTDGAFDAFDGRPSTYPANGSAAGNDPLDHLRWPLASQSDMDQQALASDFPPAFFLDSIAFRSDRVPIRAPFVRVPPGVLSALGSSSDLRVMIERYFDSVHAYFPIVSKMRLYQHLSSPLHEPGADTALLFLAMKLVAGEIPEGQSPRSRLYQDVKSLYNHIEAQGGFSVTAIQALLLVCLYECGHAIYPAAYLSVGHAARLAYAEGLHDRTAPQMFGRASTWTENEERRRVWWAVIVLDRFVHIGCRDKPFATSDPQQDTFLPTDDSSWDRGEMLAQAPLALSASNTVPATPFARTCQAAFLTGRILRHLDDKQLPSEYTIEEGIQLHRTMTALTDVLLSETTEHEDELTQPMLCGSMGICYSGLSTLYDSHMCTERVFQHPVPESKIVMMQTSIAGLKEISEKIVRLARCVRRFVEQAGLDRMNPFVIDCFYQASANYAWYLRETSDPNCSERLAELKEVLALLDRRWRVAGTYLFLLSEFWANQSWVPIDEKR